jgi:hypothetical protein
MEFYSALALPLQRLCRALQCKLCVNHSRAFAPELQYWLKPHIGKGFDRFFRVACSGLQLFNLLCSNFNILLEYFYGNIRKIFLNFKKNVLTYLLPRWFIHEGHERIGQITVKSSV